MLAFALSLSIFLFNSFLGYAALNAIAPQWSALKRTLLSPSIGIAITVIALFWTERSGAPVQRFGIVVAVGLLVLTVVALVKQRRIQRPTFAELAPFAVALIAVALLVSWPLLKYGFGWVSIANGDMAFYTTDAQALYRLGLYHALTPDWLFDRDAALSGVFTLWGGGRYGCQLLLAELMALTHLNAFQVYMPLMLAIELSLVSACAALLLSDKRGPQFAIACMVLVGISPLLTYGLIFQLMPQQLGLTLLLAACACPIYEHITEHRAVGRPIMVCALALSALLIVYPEVSSFYICAVAILTLMVILRKKSTEYKRLSTTLFALLAACTVLALPQLRDAVDVIRGQFAGGGTFVSTAFPEFLWPGGIALFWGLAPIGHYPSYGIFVLLIALGVILSAVGAVSVVALVWRRNLAAAIALSMFSLGCYLFWHKSDFGLFKLAMYVQPFLICSVCLAFRNVLTKAAA